MAADKLLSFHQQMFLHQRLGSADRRKRLRIRGALRKLVFRDWQFLFGLTFLFGLHALTYTHSAGNVTGHNLPKANRNLRRGRHHRKKGPLIPNAG